MFGCWISLSNGHFSRCLFLTESVDELIKRLSHFKIIPKSSSNWLFFVFVSFLFFKITNQSKKSNILFQKQLRNRLLSVCRPPTVLWIQSLQLQCVLFSRRKVHSIHSLSVPSGTCTCWWAVISQLIPSSFPGLVTSRKTILYKFSLKFLIFSSIFRKFRFHRRRENVWNKFRKQSWSHLNPLWSESVQAFHNICHSWRCDLKWCWLGF